MVVHGSSVMNTIARGDTKPASDLSLTQRHDIAASPLKITLFPSIARSRDFFRLTERARSARTK